MDQLWQRFEAISHNNLKGSRKEKVENCEKHEEDERKDCNQEGEGRLPEEMFSKPHQKILKPQVDISLVEGGGTRAFT